QRRGRRAANPAAPQVSRRGPRGVRALPHPARRIRARSARSARSARTEDLQPGIAHRPPAPAARHDRPAPDPGRPPDHGRHRAGYLARKHKAQTKAHALPPKRAGARLRRTRLAVTQPYSVHQSSSSSLPLAACLVLPWVAAGEPPLVGRCCAAAAAAGETWVAWWLADWAGCTAVGGAEPPLPLRGALAGAAGAAGATWVGGAAGAGSGAMAGLAGGACIAAASMPGSSWPPSSWRTCARWVAMLSFCLVSSSTSRWAAARRRSASA